LQEIKGNDMKYITPTLIALFFMGCFWFGAAGFPRFYTWTVTAGFRDGIMQVCPYMMAGGFVMFLTSIVMLLKSVIKET